LRNLAPIRQSIRLDLPVEEAVCPDAPTAQLWAPFHSAKSEPGLPVHGRSFRLRWRGGRLSLGLAGSSTGLPLNRPV